MAVTEALRHPKSSTWSIWNAKNYFQAERGSSGGFVQRAERGTDFTVASSCGNAKQQLIAEFPSAWLRAGAES